MKLKILGLLLLLCSPALAQTVGPGPTSGSTTVVGTWTPTLIGSSGGTATLSVAVGSYVNTGTWWHANAVVTASSVTGLTGNAQIGNFPWTQANTANDVGECTVTQYSNTNFATSTTVVQGASIAVNTKAATLIQVVTGASQPFAASVLPASDLTATSSFNISCDGHT